MGLFEESIARIREEKMGPQGTYLQELRTKYKSQGAREQEDPTGPLPELDMGPEDPRAGTATWEPVDTPTMDITGAGVSPAVSPRLAVEQSVRGDAAKISQARAKVQATGEQLADNEIKWHDPDSLMGVWDAYLSSMGKIPDALINLDASAVKRDAAKREFDYMREAAESDETFVDAQDRARAMGIEDVFNDRMQRFKDNPKLTFAEDRQNIEREMLLDGYREGLTVPAILSAVSAHHAIDYSYIQSQKVGDPPEAKRFWGHVGQIAGHVAGFVTKMAAVAPLGAVGAMGKVAGTAANMGGVTAVDFEAVDENPLVGFGQGAAMSLAGAAGGKIASKVAPAITKGALGQKALEAGGEAFGFGGSVYGFTGDLKAAAEAAAIPLVMKAPAAAMGAPSAYAEARANVRARAALRPAQRLEMLTHREAQLKQGIAEQREAIARDRDAGLDTRHQEANLRKDRESLSKTQIKMDDIRYSAEPDVAAAQAHNDAVMAGKATQPEQIQYFERTQEVARIKNKAKKKRVQMSDARLLAELQQSAYGEGPPLSTKPGKLIARPSPMERQKMSRIQGAIDKHRVALEGARQPGESLEATAYRLSEMRLPPRKVMQNVTKQQARKDIAEDLRKRLPWRPKQVEKTMRPVEELQKAAKESQAEQAKLQGDEARAEAVGKKSLEDVLPKELMDATPTEVTQTMNSGFVPWVRGFADMNETLASARKGFSFTKKMWKNLFYASMDVDQAAWKIMRSAKPAIDAAMADMEPTLRMFDKIATEVYGEMTVPKAREINRFLTGIKEIKDAPEKMRPILQRMRDDIDVLSKQLSQTGLAREGLQQAIGANLGKYVFRAYEGFTNPRFEFAKPDTPIHNKAKAELQELYPKKTPEQIDNILATIAAEAKDGGSLFEMMAAGDGKTFTKMLQRRKALGEGMREYLGEIHDPKQNYSKTMQNLVTTLQNDLMHESLKEFGKKMGWMMRSDAKDIGVRFTAEVPGKSSRKSLAYDVEPYITKSGKKAYRSHEYKLLPEFAEAIKKVLEPDQRMHFPRWIIKANSVIKTNKTVYNHLTHMRNVQSQMLIGMRNGHASMDALGVLTKYFGAEMNKNPDKFLKLTADGKSFERTDLQEWIVELKARGVVNDSFRPGQLADLVKNAYKDQEYVMGSDDMISQLRRATTLYNKNKITDLYRVEDDMVKAGGYEVEKAMWRKAYPEWNENQIQIQAAQRVAALYPTWSRVGRIAAGLNTKLPAVGDFAAFRLEMFRNQFNWVKTVASELKDPRTRPIAYQRMAGAGLAWAADPFLIAPVLRTLVGGEESEINVDDARRFLPPWMQNKQLEVVKFDKATRTMYIRDTSNQNADKGTMMPVLTALMRGDEDRTAGDNVREAMLEFLGPLGSQTMLMQAATKMATQKDERGNPLGRENTNLFDPDGWLMANFDTFVDLIAPGSYSNAEKLAEAYRQDPNEYTGDARDMMLESIAQVGGMRVLAITLDTAAGISMSRNWRQFNKDDAIAKDRIKERAENTPEDRAEAYNKAEERRQRTFQTMRADYLAMRRMGLPDKDLNKIYKLQGVSTEVRRAIRDGELKPYRPSKTVGSTYREGRFGATKKDVRERRREMSRMGLDARRKFREDRK